MAAASFGVNECATADNKTEAHSLSSNELPALNTLEPSFRAAPIAATTR